MVSHISRKTSEIPGTRGFVMGTEPHIGALSLEQRQNSRALLRLPGVVGLAVASCLIGSAVHIG